MLLYFWIGHDPTLKAKTKYRPPQLRPGHMGAIPNFFYRKKNYFCIFFLIGTLKLVKHLKTERVFVSLETFYFDDKTEKSFLCGLVPLFCSYLTYNFIWHNKITSGQKYLDERTDKQLDNPPDGRKLFRTGSLYSALTLTLNLQRLPTPYISKITSKIRKITVK